MDLEEDDWDLEDDKMSPVDNPTEDFELLSRNQTVYEQRIKYQVRSGFYNLVS